ncbi:MAG: vWA domain-containing protein, partial [Phycisphaerae bacterium]
AERAEVVDEVDELSIVPTAAGPATNVERAVRRSVESLGGAPTAAIVVLSDGGFNQGAPAEEVARYAKDRRLPIHVIGIGDPSVPRNVRITEVDAPANAFQQDPFPVSCRIAADGIDGQTIRVELHERNATTGGATRQVEARDVRVGIGGRVEPVTFELRQDRVGRFVYAVAVPIVEGETVVDDNSRQTTVNVIDARTRVLVVSSGPSWEYRFLSRLLERDDTFELSCWLQSADYTAVRDGNTVIDHLPAAAEELFEYDIVILMNPDPRGFDEKWCELVDAMVTEHGGGLLVTAGRSNTPALMRDRSLKPLHDLLPVTIDPEADLVLNEIGHYQLSGSPVEISEAAFGHPVLRLADDPISTKLLWQGMGDVYWHYPVLREKPAATVLMRHGNPRMRNSYGGHVLVAVQFVGAGRTGFVGFDSTWRWRKQGVERFDRFWVQLVRHLAEGKLLGGVKRGMLLTDSEEYALGSAVTVSARLYDRHYKPLKRDQVTARYGIDGELGEFVLRSATDRPGWYEGRFVPGRSGHYQIRLRLPDQVGDDLVELEREVHVVRPNIEILRPQMDRAKLVTLAEQSEGGRYFEVDEAGAVPGLIPDLHEEISVRSRPTMLWDNWVALLLLLALLSVEWGVRKWNRML